MTPEELIDAVQTLAQRPGRLTKVKVDALVARILAEILSIRSTAEVSKSFHDVAVSQRNKSWREIDLLIKALHEVSLASQSSMSSKEACGRIARTAIETFDRTALL